MTQTNQEQQGTFYCECLVNAKIPISLFYKLEVRLKQHLLTKFPLESHQNALSHLKDDEVLAATIETLSIERQTNSSSSDRPAKIKVFLYKYPDCDTFQASDRKLNLDSNDEQEADNLYTLESFPSAKNIGLWDSLEFDSDIKAAVLSYISAIFRFSLLGLAERPEISFNRLIFLHGPPGTGKTSLAKALVSKLATRLYSLQKHRFTQEEDPTTVKIYERIQCLTIHSNQLFSRWFSESAKTVQKLFVIIRNLAKDENSFVVVLIDEVESIAMNRKQSSDPSSSEPTDSIRAVNTLLTQIDQLRSIPNILYITTSNFPELVDPAFIDRVDWSFKIDLPSESVIYSLLASAIAVIRSKGVIVGNEDLANSAQAAHLIGGHSNDLLAISKALLGQSGRAVKRLPLIAYSAHLKSHQDSPVLTLDQFISALQDIIK